MQHHSKQDQSRLYRGCRKGIPPTLPTVLCRLCWCLGLSSSSSKGLRLPDILESRPSRPVLRLGAGWGLPAPMGTPLVLLTCNKQPRIMSAMYSTRHSTEMHGKTLKMVALWCWSLHASQHQRYVLGGLTVSRLDTLMMKAKTGGVTCGGHCLFTCYIKMRTEQTMDSC